MRYAGQGKKYELILGNIKTEFGLAGFCFCMQRVVFVVVVVAVVQRL